MYGDLERDFPYFLCIVWIGKVVTPENAGRNTRSILNVFLLPKISSELVKMGRIPKRKE